MLYVVYGCKLFLTGYSGHSMSPTYLFSVPPKEALRKVKELYAEEGYVMYKVAERLGCSKRTLERFVIGNGFSDELKKMRVDALREELNG